MRRDLARFGSTDTTSDGTSLDWQVSDAERRQRGGGILLGVWAAVFAALGLVLLAPVLSGGLFADDWEFLTSDPRRHILGAFFETHPYSLTRPIEWSLFALFQTLFGSTTLPMHLANLAIHVGLAVLAV